MEATNNGNGYSDHNGDGLIRFEFNTPVEVALKYADGKQVEGRYGDSLLFSCTNGKRFFVPLPVGEQIAALGIQPGEPITILKHEGKNGRKRTAAYEVRRVSSSAPAVAGPALVPTPAAAVAAPSPAPQQQPTIRRTVYEYYKAAIDILAEAEKYAKARELQVEFNAEDVRALAATLLIQRKEWSSWQL
jgi:hypothetical protein